MKARIVLVGAGSVTFGHSTIAGLFAERASLEGSTLVLLDIDREKVEAVAAFTRAANAELGHPFTIEATTNRLEALPQADFIVVSVEQDIFGGWQNDWEIPNRYGIVHMLGENGGPGGLSHALRTVRLVLDICLDAETLAPNALVLNYTNPLSRVCLGLSRYTKLRVVGLCHGIAEAFVQVAHVMGWVTAPRGSNPRKAQLAEASEFLDIQACGINHLTFMTSLRDRRTGEDLLPEFHDRLATYDPTYQPVSRRMFDIFGLYPVQGDSHVGEYVAWARPTEHPFEGFLESERTETARLATRMRSVVDGTMAASEVLKPLWGDHDRAPSIIGTIVGGRNGYELAVNVVNDGSIKGLPDWSIVEAPGVVGPAGVQAVSMGGLPPAITALLNEQIAIQDRVVEAAVHGDRSEALTALMLDPVCNGDLEIAREMLRELLEANALYLPQFSELAPSTQRQHT